MSILRPRPLVLVLLLALAAALPAAAAELAGVTMPNTATVAGQTLQLNGMGLRKKLFIKVYVAGLYLAKKSGDANAILAADQPRQLVMHFLYGVDKGKICEAWMEGLDNNRPNASDVVKAQFVDLCDMMEDFEKGDRMFFTFDPATGTTVNVKGENKGTVAGKPFADAIFSTWIGPEPPSDDFKEGLLGE
jgi:hypothetical protein